ncbi:metallophosphatase [Pseudoalteromonas citrea]|uniref:Metallophosphatase n=1 Tax=Pseudoalteromonas citrea TaxID=43655 RepID=A0A5S3XW90_9GAMM|nr:alkaline phosphatase D family protein [Pseudoalteromonas citrea]TMP40529.1 metallophosphatase [Pseudoalteromonas citrea]TMP61821.1 metallophosphatase [Pseudoalteromonas citrea]
MSDCKKTLPMMLLGPMIRRAEPHQVCIQLVTSCATQVTFSVSGYDVHSEQTTLELGKYCYLHTVIVTPLQGDFIVDQALGYGVYFDEKAQRLDEFCYGGLSSPQFIIPKQLSKVLHGSCRNPHHSSKDSLVMADTQLEGFRQQGQSGPSLLLMSGDQIYADDVAGAMLLAIHQLIDKLGLYRETLNGLGPLEEIQKQLFNREHLLPKTPWQACSKRSLRYWTKTDDAHFTSMHACNHLMHFEEFIAYYLLAFSPVVWTLIETDKIRYKAQDNAKRQKFYDEWLVLQEFITGLPNTQRLFANISTLMMFDDHDVTDDWNLTAQWEQAIASNSVSSRIIHNGLLSYWLFQGLGNDAMVHSKTLLAPFEASLVEGQWLFSSLDKELQRFGRWHFCLDTFPKVVVLDTRTHRWRNEQNFAEPSGLMDWEMLMELQETLVNHEAVILVSPPPVFGVKSIEAIQAAFNICGQPLMVDVENWMAHEGSAKKLLDIFKRADTPKETIILSGDVHYSFCFSVQSRFGRHHNRIWQLTASGIKNEFPKKLIACLDKLDSIFYGPWSPLNFFTKRWQMEVNKHPLEGVTSKQPYLVSNSAISLISLEQGKLAQYELWHGDGSISEFSLDLE